MEKTNDNEVKDIFERVLELVDNKTTKMKIEKNIKNSYYVFLNDIIYLSTRHVDSNKKDTRLVLICHECIHSVQSKLLHWVNFILANLELFLFLVVVILKYIFKQESIVLIYSVISILSIIVRGVLEIDASIKSINLTRNYLEKYKNDECNLSKIKKQMILTFPIFLVSLFCFKIIRFIIVII